MRSTVSARTARRSSPARRRGPGGALLALVVGAGVVGAGAWAGAWYLPFVVGLGLAVIAPAPRWSSRGVVGLAVASGVVGWGWPLLWLSARGLPVGATARVVAALAGIPAYAAVGVVAALLVSGVQGLLGAWSGRALVQALGGGARR